MFPVIPSNLNLRSHGYSSAESINSYVTGSAKLLVPGRVTALNNIAQGSMTVAIEPEQLTGKPDIVQVSVAMNPFGTIELDSNSQAVWSEDIHWVRALRLSDDCHSNNIQLRLQPSQRLSDNLTKNLPAPKLILQAVRPIDPGQELLLWFSEDISAMLQIMFLTPANIQGQKKYVCSRCCALYESPNPLKLHITLGCGKYSVSYLWEKLSNALGENSLHNLLKKDIFDFKLSPEPSITRQRNAIDLSTSHIQQREFSKTLYRPYSEPSAFKPFKKIDTDSSNEHINMSPTWPIAIPACHNQEQSKNVNANLNQEYETHIETLVSSLGRSKQGHICLYCGKCYSRKYGLKIHIRTHTGYKPLECKYCRRPFGDPSNLNKHVRLHAEGNTPYKCDLCGKVLVRRRDLERHLKSRHMIETHPDLNLLPDENKSDASSIHNEETSTLLKTEIEEKL